MAPGNLSPAEGTGILYLTDPVRTVTLCPARHATWTSLYACLGQLPCIDLFIAGVSFAADEQRHLFGMIVALLSLVYFTGCVFYARFEGRRLESLQTN